MQNSQKINPNIEMLTGFAGAKFNEGIEESNKQRAADNPLRKLFDSGNSEMFEGSESFTWISRE